MGLTPGGACGKGGPFVCCAPSQGGKLSPGLIWTGNGSCWWRGWSVQSLMMVNVSFHHVVSAYAAAQPQNCGMAYREKFSTGRARECIKLPGNYNIKKDSIEIKIKKFFVYVLLLFVDLNISLEFLLICRIKLVMLDRFTISQKAPSSFSTN